VIGMAEWKDLVGKEILVKWIADIEQCKVVGVASDGKYVCLDSSVRPRQSWHEVMSDDKLDNGKIIRVHVFEE